MTRLSLVAFACLLTTGFADAQSASDKSVQRLDPALDALVSPDAKVELVKGGFGFTEGPVWMQEGKSGFLLFTDIPGAVVWKLTPDGKASVYLDHTGYNGPEVWRWGGIQNNGFERTDPRFEEFAMIGADGLTVDRQGRLILATFAGRSLMRVEKNGKRTVLADRYDGKRFGGPNDVVVKSDGAIYFTDTFGSFRQRDKDPRKELDFTGVYRWKDGKLSLVVKDMPMVNGLAFSPDEKYLYVNGSRDSYVNRYDVLPDGSLANGKLFIDLSKDPARHHRRTAGRYQGQSLRDRPRRGLDHLAGGQAPRHHRRAGAGHQCGLRRRRQEDALHRGAHRHLQDQGAHAGDLAAPGTSV
jgi:gluconolactonase